MNEIKAGDRVTGLYFGEAYIGTVSEIDNIGIFVALDDKRLSMGSYGVVISQTNSSRISIRLLIPDPIGPYTDADNDYHWQADANVYPFDTVTYEPIITFPAEDNEIVTQYLDGTLQVIISRNLNKHQAYHFCVDVQRAMGIKTVELDNEAQFSSGYTAFVCTFRQGVLRDIEAIRVDVKAYVQGFLDRLAALPPEPIAPPEPVTLQLSLF